MMGLGAQEVRKEMSDPISKQRVMQRGGFPWALTGLSLLPALLGKGDDTIRSQMSLSREPVMLRGGLSVLPALTKSLPLVKDIAAPLALGALASLGDDVVDKIFGEGMKRPERTKVKKLRKRRSPHGNVKKLLKSVTASDFGSNGPRFESSRGRCVESLDKALYSHCPKEKPSH